MDLRRSSSNHCSTTPRNLLDPNNYQIDKASCDTSNSFPRHKSQNYSALTTSGLPTRGNGEMREVENPAAHGEEETPLLPKRSSSLFTPGGASTLTMRHSKSPRECASTLNPKRISIATSTFWLGHPDMEKFANALDFGHETMKTQSVWGTSEPGSGTGVGGTGTECVDIWGDPPAVKKGVLMQQREKLWSRWKERYVILTRDYLTFFRRSANIHRSGVTLSEMGSFIFKLRLADVEEIRWENRRSGSLVALVLPQEPRILLRVPNENTEALHQWYTLLQECIYMSKERRQALRNHHTSTYKTYSTTKSNGDDEEEENDGNPSDSPKISPKSKSSSSMASSSSPHSSSDETDGDLIRQHERNTSSRISGKYSTKSKSSNSQQTKSSRKYSPVVVGDHDDDHDQDEDDYADKLAENDSTEENRGGGGASSSDPDEYVPVTLRRTSSRGGGLLHSRSGSNLTLNDFVKNPWKPSADEHYNHHRHPSHSDIAQKNHNHNGTSPRKLSKDYAVPVDSLLRPQSHLSGKRPESWTPQPNLFYRTPSLVPSHWVNKRDLPLARTAGPPFGRSTMIVCPSRLTAEVTYIRRM